MKFKAKRQGFPLFSKGLPLLLSFCILLSTFIPFSAYAKEISLYSMQFKFGQNYTFGANYEPLFTGTTYQSNAGKKDIYFLNSNQVLVNSPIMLTVNWYSNQDKEFTITKGQYINVNTVFWENSRILDISDAVLTVSNGTVTKYLHVGYPSFNHSTGECSFSVQAPFDFVTDTFYITFVLGFRNDFGNTYFKISSLELDTGSNTDHLLSNLKDFLSNILQSILTGIQNIPTAFSNAINNIQGWLHNLGLTITSAIGNIQDWLNSLGTTLSNAIGNIQGWLSSLGTTISNKLTSVSTQIRDKIQSMTDSVESFFFDLDTNISLYLQDLANSIRDFFVPSAAWRTQFKNDWDTLISNKFGALIQAKDLISNIYNLVVPLFNSAQVNDLIITLPAIRLPNSITHNGNLTLIPGTTFSFYNNPILSDTILNEHLWDIWSAMVNVISIFLLITFIKRQYYRIFGGEDRGGQNL